MKLLSALICLCSSTALAYPGWDDATVVGKAKTCVATMEKQGTPTTKARNHCVCFLDYTMSRLTEKELSILQSEAPDVLTRFMDKAWGFCQHNLK